MTTRHPTPFDDRDILRLLRAAGRPEPAPADHAAAADRVRAALAAHGPAVGRDGGSAGGRPPGRRRVAAKVAASVALLLAGAAAVVVALQPRPAAAAWAELQAAADATERFRGWVSVRDEAAAEPFLRCDTVSGSQAVVRRSDAGGRTVELLDRQRATHSLWVAARRTVYTNDLEPALMAQLPGSTERIGVFVDLGDRLRQDRADFGPANVDVRSVREADATRYDVDLYVPDAVGKRAPTPAQSRSYWVDAKTGRVAKMRYARAGGPPATQVYGYDDPAVADLYSLGVPPDAAVVDRRPAGPLRDRLAVLDRRVAAGTGGGVAVVTTVVRAQDPPTADGPVLDTLELFARSGDRRVWARYLVGTAAGRDAGLNAVRPQLPVPPGWPALSPAAAVELVKDVRPHELAVLAGGRTYRLFGGDDGPADDMPTLPGDVADNDLPGRFWPGRDRLHLYWPWSAGSLAPGAGGDTEVVSVVTEDAATQVRRFVTEMTLDRRTGLPTEVFARGLTSAGVDHRTERWTFGPTFKTPAGVDLPQRWAYEQRYSRPVGHWYRADGALRFDPAATVPEAWFGPPAKRFPAK